MYQVFGPNMSSSIVEKESRIRIRTSEWGQLLKPFLEHKVQVHQTQEMCYLCSPCNPLFSPTLILIWLLPEGLKKT
jgi:hypothetical protein